MHKQWNALLRVCIGQVTTCDMSVVGLILVVYIYMHIVQAFAVLHHRYIIIKCCMLCTPLFNQNREIFQIFPIICINVSRLSL